MHDRDHDLIPTPSGERLVLGLAGLALVSGCNEPETCDDEIAATERPTWPEPPDPVGPPAVTSARWLDDEVLELQFSEALEALSGGQAAINPLRFRVLATSLRADAYYDCSLSTSYYVPRQGYSAIYPIQLWQAPEDAAILRLRMNQSITCGAGPGDGLMLVYTNNPVADVSASVVRDVDGDPLPDLGPMWAISGLDDCFMNYSSSYYYYSGFCGALSRFASGVFPSLDSLADIPCPDL